MASVVITPQDSVWMSGYASRDRPAEGRLTELWAKALVVEDPQGHRAVLITLDVIGIDRELSLRIRDELRERYGFLLPQIALCASHTHTGPVVGDNLKSMLSLNADQKRQVSAYADSLRENVTVVVGEALKDLRESHLSWGIGRATFAVNRRENGPESEIPERRLRGTLKGPVDHDVPVLQVKSGEMLRCVVAGYACHCTVLSFYQWSGDYAGFAQIELERRHPGTMAMFWAGCGGDQNPLPRRAVALAVEYGRQLAVAVDDVLVGHLYPIEESLGTVYEEIHLPLATLPTRQEIEANTRSENRFETYRARDLLEQLERDGRLSSTYPYPLQTWRLGRHLIFVVMGGEVVVDYSLRLKQDIAPGATWVAAYANDVMAYIPSRRVLAEGGYEGDRSMVYYGLPTVWAPEIEEMIVDTVRRQVRQLRSQIVER